MPKLGERIKDLRDMKSISQDELAKEVGLSKNSIYNYENGKRLPDADALVRLAEYFDVPVDYLLGRETEVNFADISDYENALNKYWPVRALLNQTIIQLLDLGSSSENSDAMVQAVTLLKDFFYVMDAAINTPLDKIREAYENSLSVKRDKPINMAFYTAAFFEAQLDKMVQHKREIESLLGGLLHEFTTQILHNKLESTLTEIIKDRGRFYGEHNKTDE